MTPAAVRCTLAAAVLLAGCSSGAAGADARGTLQASATTARPALPAVPGMTAEAVRLRTDEAAGGRVQVKVANTGTEPFTVTSVALVSPGFTALPPREVSVEVPPGRRFDLPTAFGTAVCEAPVQPAGADLTVVRPDGRAEQLRVPLAGSTMELVHGEQCDLERLAETVALSLEELTDTGDVVTGTAVLTRVAGDEPVGVDALAGSVLLDAEPGTELPARLAPGATELRLPVSFSPARCDPHALGEAKKPFVFPLTVTVGETDPVVADLPVDEAGRALLQAYVDRECGVA